MTEPMSLGDLKGARILIVDDVAQNIQVLGSGLRSEGYSIIPATSGEQALRSAATHKPELVLLDVMMPEMNGYETLERLRTVPGCEHTPVIFVTALSEAADEEKGLRLGAVDYITKPINIHTTRARVTAHLRLARAMTQLADQNAQLIAAAKLREDVDRISRHDLKSPLQVIISVPNVIQLSGSLNEQQLDLLRRVKKSGYRMLELIDSSLDMFKMETGAYQFNPSPVDLIALFHRLHEELESLIHHKALRWTLIKDGSPLSNGESAVVAGEELLCYSMFSNLIKNAIEASPSGQAITISIIDSAPIKVAIHNQGAVPEPIREKFFEKYATHGKKRGTGLGTYSAHLIAKTQGASIDMRTDDAEGTTITVQFPEIS